MNFSELPVSFDPYDLWMTDIGVQAKDGFYNGTTTGKLLSVAIAMGDWLLPISARKLIGVKKRVYPITVAQWILLNAPNSNPQRSFDALMATATNLEDEYGAAWGLGFPWMSKNGLYDENIPFVTHTPYAMEALLQLSKHDIIHEQAMSKFDATWQFLEALKVMHQDEDSLALSYAPIDEPRIVVNANSYASYSYALHFGQDNHAEVAKEKATKIASWVVNQQNPDGSWHYYSDQEAGNFIDCFHTCFVIKNLLKVSKIIPEINTIVESRIALGRRYLDDNFFDNKHQLVKRFVERDIKDPFVWDIYDQAEYLGILIAFGELDKAVAFRDHVSSIFQRQGHWYCKKDFFGRLWGRDFLRWGIVPFIYNSMLLDQSTGKNPSSS